jgi:activator of HSP90 ATPase
MKNITQIVTIAATPQEVYDAFMDSDKHAAFTGSSAKIENKVGGTYDAWDGYATGKTLELVPGKKIVQTWRASDWPADAESKIVLELEPDGDKTKLIFNQTNIPDEFAADVEQGWTDYYWEPLKDYLKQGK